MRLLIVSGIFHPDVGGPATYLHELAHALVKDGHDVAVLAYGAEDPPGRYPFRVWRVPRSGSAVLRLVRFTWMLLRVSRGYPLWYVNDYGIPALIVARVRRPAIVMKVVGDFAWEYARRNALVSDGIDQFQERRHGVRLELLKHLQRRYVQLAARVIVPSVYLAGLVRGWGVESARITVVRNAVSWATVSRGSLSAMHDDANAASAATVRDSMTLFTAARLAPWKGIDHLLRSFALLRMQVPRAALVIAGDGPEAARLRALADQLEIADAVTWLGDVERDVILHWMRKATVFLLLSEYEGLSHVLLEAMAEGLPVVASAAGGNAELITDGCDGLIVDPREHAATARCVRALLEDGGRRAQLAAAARQRVAGHTWDRLLDETRAVFESARRRAS